MIIKASSSLRNGFPDISKLARETQEPIYITNNGEGDGVYMNLEAFQKREELLNLRDRIITAEENRLSGARTYSSDEILQILRKRLND